MKRLLILILVLAGLTACEKTTEDNTILRLYGDAREDIGYSVVETNGGYVIAGLVTDLQRAGQYIDFEAVNRNMGIVKLDWSGNQIWKLSVGGDMSDEGSSLIVLDDGSFICTGMTSDTTLTGSSNADILIAKISADGELLWEKKIGGGGNQKGSDIVQSSDGGFVIVGYTDSYRAQVGNFSENAAGRKDIFIAKTNSDGVTQWTASYGFGGDDFGVKVKKESSGNYIILGTTDNSEPGQAKNNMILIKINSLGSVISSKIIGDLEDENAADIEVVSDGYYIAGTVVTGVDDQEIEITRLSSNIFGTPIFTSRFKKDSEGTTSSKVNAITVTDGTCYIAGQAGPDLTANMLIMKIDENGVESGTAEIVGGAGLQTVYDLIVDSESNIIAIGKSSNKNNSMISFLKFRF